MVKGLAVVSDRESVTELLLAWGRGDEAARDALVPLVYAQLRRIAQNRLRAAEGATIQATGLVHEVYLRLIDRSRVRCENRAHFFAIAARVMRQILIERHRARRARKRGGAPARVALQDIEIAATPVPPDMELLAGALDRLARQDERQARLIELRFFGGLTVEELAEVVGVSPATVKRELLMARAWLKREMNG